MVQGIEQFQGEKKTVFLENNEAGLAWQTPDDTEPYLWRTVDLGFRYAYDDLDRRGFQGSIGTTLFAPRSDFKLESAFNLNFEYNHAASSLFSEMMIALRYNWFEHIVPGNGFNVLVPQAGFGPVALLSTEDGFPQVALALHLGMETVRVGDVFALYAGRRFLFQPDTSTVGATELGLSFHF